MAILFVQIIKLVISNYFIRVIALIFQLKYNAMTALLEYLDLDIL